MATFVAIPGRGRKPVYVNPERITYLRPEGEKTVLFFGVDRSVELEEPISEVLRLLDHG
jgi:hypothetical protein